VGALAKSGKITNHLAEPKKLDLVITGENKQSIHSKTGKPSDKGKPRSQAPDSRDRLGER